MLSGEQPCFQLLRFGSSTGESARDLYTFRPTQSRSVFRLGRAAELCDVTLDSAVVSRIHAELHAEREAGEEEEEEEREEECWKVYIKDRSSHGKKGGGASHTQEAFYTLHSKQKFLFLTLETLKMQSIKQCFIFIFY